MIASSCALATAIVYGKDLGTSRREKPVAAARAVLSRALGARASEFELTLMPAKDGHQVYELSASEGRVHISGSSGVALCRGAYRYLREACNCMITWSGSHLDLPTQLPSLDMVRCVCPYEQVQYYNPCTFGYSTAFWNWERWQRELDWMALHGITMALALEGQEAIWHRVWLKMGVSEAELERYFTGPAQLPWHRLGNINNFDGPLPVEWMEQHRALQHRILDRMHDLGITPIVPGFSGFVPQGFLRVYPEAKAYSELWHSKEMPRLSKTFILDPRDTDLYKEIGALFIQAYKREFGPCTHYLVDTFNELRVPVSQANRYTDLAQFARSVFDGIVAGDRDGIWVMEGWLFRDKPQFWDHASVKAFLSGIPDDRLIILDYSNDSKAKNKDAFKNPTEANVWKQNDAFHGKRWINGMIHTFGGNNNVKGNLALIASQPAAVLNSPDKGNLIGWSINPEGIQTNEVVYELMTDIGWPANEINLDAWIVDYCKARYGACPDGIKQAWELLLQSAYSRHSWNSRHAWQCRPTLEPAAVDVDSSPLFREATEQYLSCASQFSSSELYRNDLIELVAQSVGGAIDTRLEQACTAHRHGNPEERNYKAGQALSMLSRVDGLLNVRVDRRLETWVEQARSWARADDAKAYYEENGRRLITSWGWPDLDDYASRVWSGLIRDYYAGRWSAFFEGLRSGASADLDIWEETWLSKPYKPSTPLRTEDLVTEARNMLNSCKQWT
jgi:alpha-N-acetylglucosaminidase